MAPPRVYDIFQMVSEAVRTPAAKMVMVCQVGVPKWDRSPSWGEGMGGVTMCNPRGFEVKGDTGEGSGAQPSEE